MNLLIDPDTGAPRWSAVERQSGPKEDFALEAARRLQSGEMTLDELKAQIIAAANAEWRTRGMQSRLHTLNDVKECIGKSGKDWFFEIQRVFHHPSLLAKLVEEKGRGLTALARKAGPIQAQRPKNYSDRGAVVKELIATLEEARRSFRTDLPTHTLLLEECKKDLEKYRSIMRTWQ